MKLLVPAVLAVMAWVCVSQTMGAPGPFEDVPLGALPADAVKQALQKTLSPQGRFVILAAAGTVRIFDTPQKIADARAALVALQNGPALVSFVVVIRTGMHKVTQVTSSGGDGDMGGYDFPVPENYAPPQVIGSGRHVVVVPATPTKFTTHPVGTVGVAGAGGAGYQPYEGGFVPGSAVADTQLTSAEGGVLHRYGGSTVFPKPVAVMACALVPEPAALHDWAVQNGAAPKNEPQWAAARTEILVTPEHADSGMVLVLQPQIVVAGANGSPRVIPLRVCTASVAIKQGQPATFEGFPGADMDFYRLFLGAQESTGDALTAITVGAAADYTYAARQQPEKK